MHLIVAGLKSANAITFTVETTCRCFTDDSINSISDEHEKYFIANIFQNLAFTNMEITLELSQKTYHAKKGADKKKLIRIVRMSLNYVEVYESKRISDLSLLLANILMA